MLSIRMMQGTHRDHFENCNSIHCDIVAAVISKFNELEERGVSTRAGVIESIRSFVAERPSRRLALMECLSSSNVHQTLTERCQKNREEVSKPVVDSRDFFDTALISFKKPG